MNLTARERDVLAAIRDDPLVSQQDLAARFGISRSAVAGHVMNLAAKGFIKGRGYLVSEGPFVAVIGAANLDIHARPSAGLRLHDSNPGAVRTSPGGVARNVAENLARLGVETRLIAPLGDDHHGDLLERQGREAGIDMRHVYRVEGARTPTYVSVLDETGEMLAAVNDMAILDTLDADRLRPHEAMLKRASLVVLDTNLPEPTLAWLAATLAGRPLFVDTVSVAKARRILPSLESVHTLKPSLAEAEALAGISASTRGRLPGLAAWFHARGVARLFISLGDGGVFHSTPAGCGLVPPDAAAATVRNTGGAGDALLAGLAYGWLSDWSPGETLHFAMAAARLALCHPAAVNPDMSVAAVRRTGETAHAG